MIPKSCDLSDKIMRICKDLKTWRARSIQHEAIMLRHVLEAARLAGTLPKGRRTSNENELA